MADKNEIKDIVPALIDVKIAVESLIPDPTQTIGEYRRGQRKKNLLLWYGAIVSTLALVVSVVVSIVQFTSAH